MSRLSGANLTASEAAHVEFRALVKLDFPSGVLYFNSGAESLTYAGNTYIGVGHFGSADMPEEDIAGRPSPLTLRLSGVDSSLVSAVTDDDYFGRDVYVYAAWLNVSTLALVADPIQAFFGRMDYVTIAVDGASATISLTAENDLARWNRPRLLLNTDETQRYLWPGDTGMKYVQRIQNITLYWGGRPTVYSPRQPPGGDRKEP